MRGSTSRLTVIAAMVILSGQVVRGEEPPRAYLNAGQLLDLYRSMYSSIHNMSVSYTHRQEGTPSREDPNAFDRLVPWERVQRIEEGDKYHVRYSTDRDAFEQGGEVTEHAFDGSVTRQYFPQSKSGSVQRGKTGWRTETMNELTRFMLLTQVDLPKESRMRKAFPDGARLIDVVVSRRGTVRPRLEQVAGEWCHVIDTAHPLRPASGSTIWLAADKGGLPMKFEKYGPGGTCSLRIVVGKVGATETEVGPVWYTKEAVFESSVAEGTLTHRLVCHELAVNVPTDEDTWKFSFPIGTRVSDKVAGIYYVVGLGDSPDGKPVVLGTLRGYERNDANTPQATARAENAGVQGTASGTAHEPNQARTPAEEGAGVPPAGRTALDTCVLLAAAIVCVGALTLGGRLALRRMRRQPPKVRKI